MNVTNHFFATCSKGVEDLLQKELEQLGVSQLKISTGGISFSGEMALAYSACLWSRVASRILLQLKAFDIKTDDDLYSEIIAVDWSEHFCEDHTLAIDCFSSHSVVNNSHYATLRVKDAIVDQFTQNTGFRPSIEKDNPDIRLNVYLSDKQCLLYLDLSGEALHKRGYRQMAGSAPLRETLAASMLYRAKWQSFYVQGLPFFDPMCGSGTLLIEAAMMAADMAPGLLRLKDKQQGKATGFGFTAWKQFDRTIWSKIISDAEERKQQGMEDMPLIRGSDYSEQVVGIARKNIQLAGLSYVVKVNLQDATKDLVPPSDEKGLIVSNPPYGKRIGDVQLLRTLYYRFGKQLKSHFNGWTAVIITSETELARSIGLRAFRKNTLYNGALKSVLYQYRIDSLDAKNHEISDEKTVADLSTGTQVVDTSRGGERARGDNEHAQMFINRLKKNYKHLKKWARKNDITCYRVYDADIPQYAVAIDIYEDWVYVQEYQAPKTVDRNRAFQRINDVIDSVADVLERAQENVVLKVRKKQSGSSQYQKQHASQENNTKNRLTVTENDLRFIINVRDYIDTGLFLDHRNTRQLIRKLAKDKTFLNLFAYTGSVTVYAAAGGASSTTTVDMSNTYLQWAQENLALNGYKHSVYADSKHTFIRDDCLKWMQGAVKENKKYQLIFIDPPTFSNSKKMDTALDINRDHEALLSGCLALLSDDGQIIFSTNSRGFKLDKSLESICYLKEITRLTTTEDFKRKPQHRSWCLTKSEEALKDCS